MSDLAARVRYRRIRMRSAQASNASLPAPDPAFNPGKPIAKCDPQKIANASSLAARAKRIPVTLPKLPFKDV